MRRRSARATTRAVGEEQHELADLVARYGTGRQLADELLRRWLDDPDAEERWRRLADDVQLDQELD